MQTTVTRWAVKVYRDGKGADFMRDIDRNVRTWCTRDKARTVAREYRQATMRIAKAVRVRQTVVMVPERAA